MLSPALSQLGLGRVPHISLLRCETKFVRSTNPAPKTRILPAQSIALGSY